MHSIEVPLSAYRGGFFILGTLKPQLETAIVLAE